MFKEVIEEINWCGKTLTLKTGKIARQSDGAVIVSMGDTAILCTVVSAKEVRDGIGFFPLTVHYREMAFAAGKIPGGFMKREGRSSDRETLVCRLIDRPMRPLFHPSFFNETQVICTVLSYDPEHNPDILAMIGASAACAISGIPMLDIMAAARVGYIDGEFVLNHSLNEAANSKLDLVIAGTKDSVMMVESEADQLSESDMLSAVEFGHKAIAPVVDMIERLATIASKPKWAIPGDLFSKDLLQTISDKYSLEISNAFSISSKQDRVNKLNLIHSAITNDFANDETVTSSQIDLAFDEVKAKVLRLEVLSTGIRIDGRKATDIRNIDCDVALFPKIHGSSLFTRGETQAFVAATLGTSQDEQIIDGLHGDARDRFMLQYIFPPYSVGEATPLRAPGRREVGHGKLAWRALNPVMPTKEEFPYSVRVVSEITESNGSSSMATVCGGSLAMMDAGIPLKAPVSGIAMGLIKDGEKFVILSDILGDEDYLGDMDFKVAGTENGITALQMDIKVAGITIEIMKQALAQAHDGRKHIMQCMSGAISAHRSAVSQHAPSIRTFKINKDKIRDVIGPGGKIIKDICEKTGAKIDISDDGIVEISALGINNLEMAMSMVKAITSDPEVGQIFDGKVVKILDSGAFVSYTNGKDGFLHISEIADARIDNIENYLTLDQVVKVKIVHVDNKGKVKLSIKQLNSSDNKIATESSNCTAIVADESIGNNSDDGNNRKQHKGPSRTSKASGDRKKFMGSTERKSFN